MGHIYRGWHIFLFIIHIFKILPTSCPHSMLIHVLN